MLFQALSCLLGRSASRTEEDYMSKDVTKITIAWLASFVPLLVHSKRQYLKIALLAAYLL